MKKATPYLYGSFSKSDQFLLINLRQLSLSSLLKELSLSFFLVKVSLFLSTSKSSSKILHLAQTK